MRASVILGLAAFGLAVSNLVLFGSESASGRPQAGANAVSGGLRYRSGQLPESKQLLQGWEALGLAADSLSHLDGPGPVRCGLVVVLPRRLL